MTGCFNNRLKLWWNNPPPKKIYSEPDFNGHVIVFLVLGNYLTFTAICSIPQSSDCKFQYFLTISSVYFWFFGKNVLG